jgi:hypothetical protein
MVRSLLFIFAAWLLFTVFVTVFAASAKKNEVRNLPKWAWIVICLFVPIVGGLLYLVLGRPIGGPKNRFGRIKIVVSETAVENPEEHLMGLRETIVEERDNYDTNLQNTMDEMLSLIDQTLYLLTLK